jgi:hypothetical protein
MSEPSINLESPIPDFPSVSLPTTVGRRFVGQIQHFVLAELQTSPQFSDIPKTSEGGPAKKPQNRSKFTLNPDFPGLTLPVKGSHPFVFAERHELRTPPLSSDVLKIIESYLERQSQNEFKFPLPPFSPISNYSTKGCLVSRGRLRPDQTLASPPDDIPRPDTDFSRVGPLTIRNYWDELRKCLECNSRGRSYLFERKNARDAYDEFRKGMLGTGESEYSRSLTKCFNECLEIFCNHKDVKDYASKFEFHVKWIKKKVLMPEYALLKAALLGLVDKSKEAGDLSGAIWFQKELIFTVVLEATPGYYTDDTAGGGFRVPLEDRISKHVDDLCNLTPTMPRDNGK